MKHNLKATLILIFMFLVSQVVGLGVINSYIDHKAIAETGKIGYKELPYGIERPQIEEKSYFLLFIIGAILLGTVILFVLIRFKQALLWKLWYLTAVSMCLSLAFSAFVNTNVSLVFAISLGLFKVFKPSAIIHNLTEIFIYGGLAAIFILVPVFNVFVAFALLILISIYDMYAVWKSKHMVRLAKFQTQSKMFAGLAVPYEGKPTKADYKLTEKSVHKEGQRMAILGGGDIGFPLFFAGAVMKDLLITNTALIGFLKTLIIPVFVAIALTILLIKGDKDKFYPAMPFLSIGCLVGYLVVLVI